MSVTWGRTRTISRTLLRRRWRVVRDNPVQLLSLALVGLFSVLPLVVGLPVGAYFGGQALRSGAIEAPIAGVRRIAVICWLAAAGFGVFRGYTALFDPDRRDGLLTTISHQQLLAGLLGAEALVIGLPVAVVVVVASLVFAVAGDSLLAAPAKLLAACLLLVSGFLTGLAVALVIKNGGVRSRLVSRLRTVVFVALFAAYMGVIVTNAFDAVIDPLFWLLTPTPVGWMGEVVLLTAGGPGSPLAASAGLLVVGLAVAASAPVVSRLTAWLWYADGLETVQSESDSTDLSRLAGLLGQPVVGVVSADWSRARRAPVSVSYVIYPLFVLSTPIIQTVETGQVSTLFPILVGICGAWITGALFSLNIVGNEGALLPATLLTPSPSRALVGGHIAAGALVGLPVTAAAVAVLAILSPQPQWAVLTLTVGSLLLAAAAGPIATGIGAAMPRHEAVSVSRSRTAIIPSTLAFIGYSVLIALLSLPIVAAHSLIVGEFVVSAVGIPPVALGVASLILTAVVAAAFGLVSVLFGVRQVKRFQFD